MNVEGEEHLKSCKQQCRWGQEEKGCEGHSKYREK